MSALRDSLTTNVPSELRILDQWVGWRAQKRPDGTLAKVPLNPIDGAEARVNDSTTWADFEQTTVQADHCKWSGVGFVLTANDPYVGIDLDHVRNPETGELHPTVAEWVRTLDSYTEASPSGTGLHVFIRASVVRPFVKALPDVGARAKIEVYGEGRYLTVTGDRLPASPESIEDGQLVLNAILEGLRDVPKTHQEAHPLLVTSLTSDDLAVIVKVAQFPDADKFRRLMTGDTLGYPSKSEADFALVNLLGYGSDWNLGQIDRIFRASGLMDGKWDSARGDSTYGVQTIENAYRTHKDFRLPRDGDHRSPIGDNPSLWQSMANNGGSGNLSASPSFTRLSDTEPEDVNWLWINRIPLGKLTLLEGDPDQGKSTILLDIAARLTIGAPMPDDPGGEQRKPVGVVLVAPEDGLADTIRPRFDAAGGDSTQLLAWDDKSPPLNLRDLEPLRKAIQAVDAKLVILDPIMSLIGGNVDIKQDHKVRVALLPLVALAAEMNVAIVAIRHHNKNEEQKAMHRGGGSIAFTAVARSGMLVARDPRDPSGESHVLAMFKHNLARRVDSLTYRIETAHNGAPYIVWGDTVGLAADDLVMPTVRQSPREEPSTQAELWLSGLLDCGCKPAKEIQEAARLVPIADRTLQRAKSNLRVLSRRRGFGRGGVVDWCHPDAPPSIAV